MSAKKPVVPKSRAEQKLAAFHDEDNIDKSYDFQLLARLWPATGEWEYLNAGHPAGYVLGPEGTVKAEMVSSAPALGIGRKDIRRVSRRLRLEKGDLVLLLTDGVLEAHAPSGEEFGEERALEVVRRERARPAADILAALLDEARRFRQAEAIEDDMTAVVIKL